MGVPGMLVKVARQYSHLRWRCSLWAFFTWIWKHALIVSIVANFFFLGGGGFGNFLSDSNFFNVEEQACDFVRKTLSKRLCPKDFVQKTLSKRLCPKDSQAAKISMNKHKHLKQRQPRGRGSMPSHLPPEHKIEPRQSVRFYIGLYLHTSINIAMLLFYKL
jgi:hypothetical protein